jgi:hypothetical protein
LKSGRFGVVEALFVALNSQDLSGDRNPDSAELKIVDPFEVKAHYYHLLKDH